MISPSDPIEAIRRQQRTESPVFWAILFAGSLLIHVVVALGMRSLLVQAIRVPVEPEPIAVEFADATDEVQSSQPEQPELAPSQAALAKPTSSSPLPDTKPITSPPEISSSRLQTPSSASEVPSSTSEPARPVQPSPRFTPPVSSRPRSVAPQGSPLAPTNPVPNRTSTTNSVASSLKTPLSNPTPTGPIASGIRLPDVPNVPNPADNVGQVAESPSQPIKPLAIPEAPTPARFRAQIQLLPEVEKDTIAKSASGTPAAIQGEASKELVSDASSCLLTPEALSAFGKAVVLRAFLDEQGQLQGEPTVLDQRNSGNSDYDNLTACVLKQWTFSPAYDQIDENTRSTKPVTIHVQVKITE